MAELPAVWQFVADKLFGEEDKPETVSVSSSVISSIGWRPPGTIVVSFHRGGQRVYEYPGTKELFEEFVAAGSHGAFFNARIR